MFSRRSSFWVLLTISSMALCLYLGSARAQGLCRYDATGDYDYTPGGSPEYLFRGDGDITYDSNRNWWLDDVYACFKVYQQPVYLNNFPKCDLDGNGAVSLDEVYEIYYRVHPVVQTDTVAASACVEAFENGALFYCRASRYEQAQADIGSIVAGYPAAGAISDPTALGEGHVPLAYSYTELACSHPSGQFDLGEFDALGECYLATATCGVDCSSVAIAFANPVNTAKTVLEYNDLAQSLGGQCVQVPTGAAGGVSPGFHYYQYNDNGWMRWTVRSTAQCAGGVCDCDVTYELWTNPTNYPGQSWLISESNQTGSACDDPRFACTDDDQDGVCNDRDQCEGHDDNLDSDQGGLPDACDPCPNGLCVVNLPADFYHEFPGIRIQKVSRDGSLIAGIELEAPFRAVLIPVADLLANPDDTSFYEYLGTDQATDIDGFSDDNNLVLVDLYIEVENSDYHVSAGAIYDRTHQVYRLLGLYDDAIDVNSCRFYSQGADLTSDGKIVYGRTATLENACIYSAFRLDTTTGEWRIFGADDGHVRLVEAASGSGDVIGGSSQSPERPVVWNFEEPDIFSHTVLGEYGVVYDVSFDGVFASVALPGATADEAYRWSVASGVERLGPGTLDSRWAARAEGISDDGRAIVGFHIYGLASGLPFVWIEGVGFGSLQGYLNWRGVSHSITDSYTAWDISGDGRIIVGRTGTMSGVPGWVAITTAP